MRRFVVRQSPRTALCALRSFRPSVSLLSGDHYATLGLSKSATPDEIKAAYRKLALKWHPDANPNDRDGAEAKFKNIGEAYRVLHDQQQRSAYDGGGMGGGFPRPGNMRHPSSEELFRGVFGHADMRKIMEEMDQMMKNNKNHGSGGGGPQQQPRGFQGMSQADMDGAQASWRTSRVHQSEGPMGQRTTRIIFTTDRRSGPEENMNHEKNSSSPPNEQHNVRFHSLNNGRQDVPLLRFIRRAVAMALLLTVIVMIAPALGKMLLIFFLIWLVVALW